MSGGLYVDIPHGTRPELGVRARKYHCILIKSLKVLHIRTHTTGANFYRGNCITLWEKLITIQSGVGVWILGGKGMLMIFISTKGCCFIFYNDIRAACIDSCGGKAV